MADIPLETAPSATRLAIVEAMFDGFSAGELALAWGYMGDVFAPANILGTVSESSGVPTGAVIERGSNANGEYVKFADGTLIMHHVLEAVDITTAVGSSLYRSANQTWTFPASFAFSSDYHVTGRLLSATSGVSVHATYGNASSSAGVKGYATASVTSDLVLFASGRWF